MMPFRKRFPISTMPQLVFYVPRLQDMHICALSFCCMPYRWVRDSKRAPNLWNCVVGGRTGELEVEHRGFEGVHSHNVVNRRIEFHHRFKRYEANISCWSTSTKTFETFLVFLKMMTRKTVRCNSYCLCNLICSYMFIVGKQMVHW